MLFAEPTPANVFVAVVVVGANRTIPPNPHNPVRTALQVTAHYATAHLVVWTLDALIRADQSNVLDKPE